MSRLANPLINEVIIPLGKKDFWNSQQPVHDKQFAGYYAHPESPRCCPRCTRGCFRTWPRWTRPDAAR